MTSASTERRFPSDFLWGVAHAGHQVEGGNDSSDTWFAENVSPTVFQELSGTACNNYELWREDIDLAAGMGLNAYRFSVEWARVEPEVGTFSADELDHYEAIVDRCLEVGWPPSSRSTTSPARTGSPCAAAGSTRRRRHCSRGTAPP